MSGNHTATSEINKDILTNLLGLNQYKNTTIFYNEKHFVLYPSIDSSSGKFDSREENLDRYTSRKGHLLIRTSDFLLYLPLTKFIREMINEVNKKYNSKSRFHRKFKIVIDTNKFYIRRVTDKKVIAINHVSEKVIRRDLKSTF
ncbi:hypothetical protein P4571_15370 [Niallia alba]|uniref:hypothetical protein n=1 Tax=Niallia alba TaxID=2729105 RepID=UPI002E1EDF96|nr:hypothetical protein [Niallia alba]